MKPILYFIFLLITSSYSQLIDGLSEIVRGSRQMIGGTNDMAINSINYYGGFLDANAMLHSNWGFNEELKLNYQYIQMNSYLTNRYNALLLKERQTAFYNDEKTAREVMSKMTDATMNATYHAYKIVNQAQSFIDYLSRTTEKYKRFNNAMNDYKRRRKNIESAYKQVMDGSSKITSGVGKTIKGLKGNNLKNTTNTIKGFFKTPLKGLFSKGGSALFSGATAIATGGTSLLATVGFDALMGGNDNEAVVEAIENQNNLSKVNLDLGLNREKASKRQIQLQTRLVEMGERKEIEEQKNKAKKINKELKTANENTIYKIKILKERKENLERFAYNLTY